MTDGTTVDAIRIGVGLIAAAGLAALVVRRLGIPYTVTLVVVGLVAGLTLPRDEIGVGPEIVLLVLVPGLVFEAALRIDLEELRRTFGGIVLLAAPGVLVSAAIVAAVLAATTGLSLELGFVVGAMVAATDPVAVIATFRRLGTPRALATLVEGESLFNDATALVVFAIAVQAVEQPVGAGQALVTFVVAVVVSVALGLAAGWLASRLVSTIDDHLVEVTLSIATAYGTYLLADAFHQSGIIATLVAGVVLAEDGRRRGMSAETQAALDVVWETIAFILTAVAFLLVGVAISFGDLAGALGPIAWGVVAILVGRAVVVYGLLGGASWLDRHPGGDPLASAETAAVGSGDRRVGRGRPRLPRLPMPWLNVLFWAGLRGAVAVAMALSLPATFPQRPLLQAITFGIVLFTLVVQGTTADLVVRRARPRRTGEAPALR